MIKLQMQWQRIYHLTPANQVLTLPNIHHNADTMAEIQTALAAGKEMITHTDAVSVLSAAQNADGGWGLYSDFPSSVLDTVLVLRALSRQGAADPRVLQNGFNFIY